MNSENNQIDYLGILLITTFFLLLTYAGYLAYQSIDWKVLERLEQAPIELPAPPIASPSPSVTQKPTN